jgi:hypothetical protein
MNKLDMLTITKMSKSDVPPEAQVVFDTYGSMDTMDASVSLDEFESLLRIEGLGVTSYLAEHEKLLAIGQVERTAYMLDIDDSLGVPVGMGQMRLNVSNESDYFRDKPFVGYTQTYENSRNGNFLRKGYGTRRLHALNLAAKTLYELPLHSDTIRTPQASRLWQRLVSEDIAESYMQDNSLTRYKFR